jgi:hypothetical protein
MKRTLVVLTLAALVAVIWLTKQPVFQTREKVQSASAGAAKSAPRPALRYSAAPVAPRSQVAKEPDACLQLLGEAVPVEAQPYLVRAVKSVQVIEKERCPFAKNSPCDMLLEDLRRKLFVDDYTFAVLASGKLDSSRANAIFDKLAANIRQLPELPAPTPAEEPLPTDIRAAKPMREYYGAMIQSENEGCRRVWNVVRTFDTNGLSSGLFKDALTYVALRSEAKEWMDEEIKQRQEVLARQVQNIFEQQLAERTADNYSEPVHSEIANIMFLQGAYHNVFAFRFEDLYGLEAGPVLAELDKLTVAGIGPELEAPAP